MQTLLFKNILVGMTSVSEMPSPALDYALDLAVLANAHLTVQIDAADDTPIDTTNYEAVFAVEVVNAKIASEAEGVATQVRIAAKARGVSCRVLSWRAPSLALKRNLAALGRTHDLSILDAQPKSSGIYDGQIETALFETGRPVLVVPGATRPFVLRHCIVAWDGSSHAARAINDAMPLLRVMDSVEVVSLEDADAEDRLRGIGLHMQRHGIAATLRVMPIVGNDVGATFIAHLHDERPDLAVIGGYAHARFREWIFGGMTRSMLGACPTALFMSH